MRTEAQKRMIRGGVSFKTKKLEGAGELVLLKTTPVRPQIHEGGVAGLSMDELTPDFFSWKLYFLQSLWSVDQIENPLWITLMEGSTC